MNSSITAMAKKTNIDCFIESSSKLLEAFPSTTALTITYANELKKQKKKGKVSKEQDNKKASNSVSFKCYEPQSGRCLKYKTYKIKELSRLLTFVGPRGVSINKIVKNPIEDEATKSDKKKPNYDEVAENTPGLASIMSNTKFEDSEIIGGVELKAETPAVEDANVENITASTTSSSKNKKKKKKGKK